MAVPAKPEQRRLERRTGTGARFFYRDPGACSLAVTVDSDQPGHQAHGCSLALQHSRVATALGKGFLQVALRSEFNKGAILFHQGSADDRVLRIIHGEVEVSRGIERETFVVLGHARGRVARRDGCDRKRQPERYSDDIMAGVRESLFQFTVSVG